MDKKIQVSDIVDGLLAGFEKEAAHDETPAEIASEESFSKTAEEAVKLAEFLEALAANIEYATEKEAAGDMIPPQEGVVQEGIQDATGIARDAGNRAEAVRQLLTSGRSDTGETPLDPMTASATPQPAKIAMDNSTAATGKGGSHKDMPSTSSPFHSETAKLLSEARRMLVINVLKGDKVHHRFSEA